VTMHSSSVGGLRFLELWNRAEAVGRLRPVERDRPTQLHKGRMLALINNHLQNEFLLSVLLTGKKKKKIPFTCSVSTMLATLPSTSMPRRS